MIYVRVKQTHFCALAVELEQKLKSALENDDISVCN